ncbi:antibiotic biosynthesis monooxygenase family protein [Celeribacter indicus]|uniref:Antibiotic biosynthesis monooxygenase n=1 Tax=Celeribacter indicus TaxID=1208324 RepID=A0A0B5DXG0_9RHOB|nr:antibiotic biosynthesis monooxygenase family protein [Celeribacter indicus]AJE44947.1 antibiotic biosynthesis monooxygenase [Celeribacter indicus]SDW96589.1 Quinol monooxygenase YgiN [Celeribacter indicus]
MILEIVRITVKEGTGDAFVQAMDEAMPLFKATEGCHGIEVLRSFEHPRHYFCLVKWDDVEAHTEKFQKSPDYKKLFNLIGATIEGEIETSHCEFLLRST